MTSQPTIGLFEYLRACRALRLEPTATTPAERVAALPPWMYPESVSTETAVWNHQRWAAQRAGDWAQPSFEDVITRAELEGDGMLAMCAAKVITQLPPPIADFATHQVTYLLAGHSLLGFAGSFPHQSSSRRTFAMVLSVSDDPTEFEARFVHETLHAFLEAPPPTGSSLPQAFREDTESTGPLHMAAAVPGLVEARAMKRRMGVAAERRALQLSRRLGYPDVGGEQGFTEQTPVVL